MKRYPWIPAKVFWWILPYFIFYPGWKLWIQSMSSKNVFLRIQNSITFVFSIFNMGNYQSLIFFSKSKDSMFQETYLWASPINNFLVSLNVFILKKSTGLIIFPCWKLKKQMWSNFGYAKKILDDIDWIQSFQSG